MVPNKYPAVTADNGEADGQNTDRLAGAGIHEVIIENAAHVANLAALDEAQFSKIFRAYRGRLRAVREDRRWRFALIFKNQGERAGATLEHAHAQLLALPFVPADVEKELAGARDYHRRSASCYYCALIEREQQAQVRVVTSSAAFIALCPAAPRFAFETWILPRVHAVAFEQADDSIIAALAKISLQVIAALDRLHANPPFNYFIHSLPLADSEQRPLSLAVALATAVFSSCRIRMGFGDSYQSRGAGSGGAGITRRADLSLERSRRRALAVADTTAPRRQSRKPRRQW